MAAASLNKASVMIIKVKITRRKASDIVCSPSTRELSLFRSTAEDVFVAPESDVRTLFPDPPSLDVGTCALELSMASGALAVSRSGFRSS